MKALLPDARRAALICALACLPAACATPATGEAALPTPETPTEMQADPAVPRDELPPQALTVGECGVFFWSADTPHRFLVFENESRGRAQVWIEGRAVEFPGAPRRGQYVFGDPYERVYRDPESGLSVSINGTIGDPLQAGQRIDRTVMRYQRSDGAHMVVPLIGHHACRTARPPIAPPAGPEAATGQ